MTGENWPNGQHRIQPLIGVANAVN